MSKIIGGNGGDIFKFAGDAMIVLWPPTEALGVLARRAAQCAIEIQRALDQSGANVAEFSAGGEDAPAAKAKTVNLSVKIGVGVGAVAILHVGGDRGRAESPRARVRPFFRDRPFATSGA